MSELQLCPRCRAVNLTRGGQTSRILMLSGIYPWTTISLRVKRLNRPRISSLAHRQSYKKSNVARWWMAKISKYCHKIQIYSKHMAAACRAARIRRLRGSYQISNRSVTQYWRKSTSKQQILRLAISRIYRSGLLMWREPAVSDSKKNRRFATIWLINNNSNCRLRALN